MNRTILLAQSLAILVSASTARGQSTDPVRAPPASEKRFAQQGRVSLAAERLFGLTYTIYSPGSLSITTISLLGSSGLEVQAAPYSTPRLGLDYFVTDGVSLGLGLAFASVSQSGSSSSVTTLEFNPRVGYAVRLNDSFSFWPRGGMSWAHQGAGRTASDFLALTLEVQFVVTPLPHLGFIFGPVTDIGITGSEDVKITQIGLQTALVGWF